MEGAKAMEKVLIIKDGKTLFKIDRVEGCEMWQLWVDVFGDHQADLNDPESESTYELARQNSSISNILRDIQEIMGWK